MTTSRPCRVVAVAAILSGGLVMANETVAQAAPAPVAVYLQVTLVPIAPGRILEVDVANLGGLVPSTGVSAVSLNVTATNVAAPGFITVYPCGQLPLVSSVNYDPSHLSTANAVLVPVSSTGSVCFYSMAAVDLVVDINGWFAAV